MMRASKPSSSRSTASTPAAKHRPSQTTDPDVADSLLERNRQLVSKLAKLRQDNSKLIEELRIYKRRSVVLREKNALLRAETARLSIRESSESVAKMKDLSLSIARKESVSPSLEAKLTVRDENFTTPTLMPTIATNSKSCKMTKRSSNQEDTSMSLKKEQLSPSEIVNSYASHNELQSPLVEHSVPIGSTVTGQVLEDEREEWLSASEDTLESIDRRVQRVRPMRLSVHRLLSYKEPSLKIKVRKGHAFF